MKYHIFLIVMFLLPIAANAQPDNLSKEVQTSYSYSGYMGFSYTFGSIYTNIVNPRF